MHDPIAHPNDFENLLAHVNERLQQKWNLAVGDTVVMLTKVPLKPSQKTNTIHIHTVTRSVL